ncbi:hydrogenase expression/formation protein HypE [Candidatus Alkanophaga liquidiphilum]
MKITMAHGAGGEAMQRLIKNVILKHLSFNPKISVEVALEDLDDSAVVEDIVFTTDAHTVKPLFFPGGDIGVLSVSGTVNDLAVMGAEPLALSSSFVIEEGFPLEDFEKILESMQQTCERAGVPIVTGDTKVVERNALDGMIVTTAGVGRRSESLDRNIAVVRKHREFEGRWLKDSNVQDGDAIIVSGSVGDHGVAILSFREGYGFESEVCSDVKPLNKMIERALQEGGIVAMKDPTRGGLANALNEFAAKSGVGIEIFEDRIPIKEAVRAACEMLGIDALEIGNEGKIVLAVVRECADAILQALRETEEGRDAEIIGYASKGVRGVVMRTSVGGRKIVEPPLGDPVPRIC